MRLYLKLLVLAIVSVAFWLACNEKNTTNPDGQNKTATLKISLTDAPAAFDAVNITFSEISAHIDSEWVIIRSEPTTVNLLEWTNGKAIELGSAEVQPGHYTQIRIKIDTAEVVVDGQSNVLVVPSGAQTGLKLVHEFTIDEGATYELVVDFDADRSIVATGPPGNPNGYILKPTLRVVAKALTGSISGVVAAPLNTPYAYAMVGPDTITSTPVDMATGSFTLAFLPEGTYTVMISDSKKNTFSVNDVSVLIGSDRDIGTIILTPGDQTGTLKISLTDAPADFNAVNITFSEISAHLDSEWVTVRVEPITVNLLEFTNGRTIEIGSADVPAGRYTQIRIKIDSAEVVVGEQVQALDVPGDAKTGLKLGPQFTIAEGSTYELIVDFDAIRSIVTTGPPHNPKGYKLKPRMRVVAKAVTGSISATVTNPENLPIAYAIAGGDTVTSTAVDTANGHFKLAFLPEGLYTVAVSDAAGLFFTKEGVIVVAGADQDLGAITLQ